MSWTNSTPYFRAEATFGNILVYINGESLAVVAKNSSLSKPVTLDLAILQGVEKWAEFANWILEQARLYDEGWEV